MARLGFGAITPSQGIQSLSFLILSTGASVAPQVIASVFYWERISASEAFFSEVKVDAADTGGHRTLQAGNKHHHLSSHSQSVVDPTAVSEAISLESVEDVVGQAVVSVLGTALPKDEPLGAAGVDSLGKGLLLVLDLNMITNISFRCYQLNSMYGK